MTKTITNPIVEEFERGFMEVDLQRHVDNCKRYELLPRFMSLLPQAQPILEAGCGSGKWIHYFKREGMTCVGLDWSEKLRQISLAHDHTIQFDTGDLRALPYKDGTFGSIIALGSIEHVIEGPGKILREFYRVLMPGGIAIITVPYLSLLRRLSFTLSKEPIRRLRRNRLLRRLVGSSSLTDSTTPTRKELLAQQFRRGVYLHVDFHGNFYQYQFTRPALEEELTKAGFQLREVFPFGFEQGLKQTFGKAVGYKDRETGEMKLNFAGRCIVKVVGRSCPHMIGAVVVRP